MMSKSDRFNAWQSDTSPSWPKSYQLNTTKEEVMLEYAENFRRQFVQLFPKRRALPLCFANECHVTKFVCTAIKPTTIPFIENHDLRSCVSFVSDFVRYHPLEEPTKFHKQLYSPSTTIGMQSGDCMEMSTLLVSMLRGYGFDAYVVAGTAPKWVTQLDLSAVNYPPHMDDPLATAATAATTESTPFGDVTNSNDGNGVGGGGDNDDNDDDGVNDQDPHQDDGTTTDAAADAAAAAGGTTTTATTTTAAAAAETVEQTNGMATTTADEHEDDTTATMAATATLLTTDARSKYQVKDIADYKSKFLEAQQTRLEKEAKMEQMAETTKQTIAQQVSDDELHGHRRHAWVLVKAGRRDVTHDVYVEPSTGVIYAPARAPYLSVDCVWSERNCWVNVQEATTATTTILKTATARETAAAASVRFALDDTNDWEYLLLPDDKENAGGGGGDDDDGVSLQTLDAPMSWCREFKIDRRMHALRYPDGYKRVQYRRCVVETWTHFFVARAGLVKRVATYNDDACTVVRDIHETFCHRKDRLYERATYPAKGRVHSKYMPGRSSGLKELMEVKDQSCVFTFHSGSRVDGMVRRDTVTKFKVMEHFEGRDDFLVYRSITVASDEREQHMQAITLDINGGGAGDNKDRVDIASAAAAAAVSKAQKGFVISIGTDVELGVRKITEKFGRNPGVHAEEDVRKRTHFIMDQKIRLDYHYGRRTVTASRLWYDRQSEQCTGYRSDPTWTLPSPGEARQHLIVLLATEKRLMSLIKDRERDMRELAKQLRADEDDEELVRTVYDVAYTDDVDDDGADVDADVDADNGGGGGADELVAMAATSGGRGSISNVNGHGIGGNGGMVIDYLSPFVAQYRAGPSLTRKQALKAREDCLKALREQLLERANIITSHLEVEHEQLKERQAVHTRATQSGAKVGGDVDEEFTKFYEEHSFRVSILQARLDRHEQVALKKYADMDRKLRNDPRLAVLTNHHA